MKRVLVADDQPSSRELVRTVLERMGYEVFEAADGIEALKQARAVNPDLIVLDLQMPGLDGFQVAEGLRKYEQTAATPVMALTANAMRGDRERALSAGFTGYVTKPIRLAVLRNEVQRLLGG